MRFEYRRATRTADGHHELKMGARAQREHHFSQSGLRSGRAQAEIWKSQSSDMGRNWRGGGGEGGRGALSAILSCCWAPREVPDF